VDGNGNGLSSKMGVGMQGKGWDVSEQCVCEPAHTCAVQTMTAQQSHAKTLRTEAARTRSEALAGRSSESELPPIRPMAAARNTACGMGVRPACSTQAREPSADGVKMV